MEKLNKCLLMLVQKMLKYCVKSILNDHKIIPTEIDATIYLVLSDFLKNIFSNVETDSNYFSSDSLNHEKKWNVHFFQGLQDVRQSPGLFFSTFSAHYNWT